MLVDASRGRGGGSWFAAAALAVLGFAIATWSVRWVAPMALEDGLQKLTYLEEHPGRHSVLFVGSSRVLRHFDPVVFDARLAADGLSVSSFNLGIPGLHLFSTDAVVDWLEAAGLDKVEWVIIDPGFLRQNLPSAQATSSRSIFWHNLSRSRMVFESLGQRALNDKIRSELMKVHLRPLLYNLFHVGVLGGRLRQGLLEPPTEMFPVDVFGAAGNGFDSLDAAVERAEARERQILERGHKALQGKAGRERYQKSVINLRESIEKRAEKMPKRDPLTESVLLSMRDSVEAMGARVLFVLGPAVSRRGAMVAAAQAGVIEPFVNYNLPDRYPSLFEVEKRFNQGHLNREGARLFTEQLARDFAVLLRKEGAEERP